MNNTFKEALIKCPVIVVLRHLLPEAALDVGEALIGAGLTIFEVPLNGREALPTLKILTKNLGTRALIGAGTVLSVQDVKRAVDTDACFVFSPNMDAEVIAATRQKGLASIPGVATPTEAFAAIKSGATALKAFPGTELLPSTIILWRTVLPKETPIIISGGVNAEKVQAYRQAGADGFGVASAVFAPELSSKEIQTKAEQFLAAVKTH